MYQIKKNGIWKAIAQRTAKEKYNQGHHIKIGTHIFNKVYLPYLSWE